MGQATVEIDDRAARGCRRTSCRRPPARRTRVLVAGTGDRGGRARGTRSWPRPSTRGSAPRRTSSARCTAATSTTAIRRRAGSSARAAGRPGNTLEAVQAEYDALVAPIAAESGCAIDVDLKLVRDAYSIDPEHPLAVALREALRGGDRARRSRRPASRSSPTPRSSRRSAGSRPSTTARAGEGAHADVESIAVDELVRSARIYLATLERLWAAAEAPRGEPAAYDELRSSFRWELPETLNLGVDVCERQPRDAPAILVTDGRAITRTVTFGELADDSNRLANALRGLGVGRGDRVGIVLPQRPETAVAHIAAAKLGAIAVPLSVLFGPDGLETRLRDAEVRVVLGEAEPLERIAGLGLDVPLVDVDRDLPALLADASPRFEAVATTPDTPALLVYTSGTTGPPKGALHAHRVLAGHLPGFELSHDSFPRDGDRIWSPGGLGLDRRPLRRAHAGAPTTGRPSSRTAAASSTRSARST